MIVLCQWDSSTASEQSSLNVAITRSYGYLTAPILQVHHRSVLSHCAMIFQKSILRDEAQTDFTKSSAVQGEMHIFSKDLLVIQTDGTKTEIMGLTKWASNCEFKEECNKTPHTRISAIHAVKERSDETNRFKVTVKSKPFSSRVSKYMYEPDSVIMLCK